MLVGSPSSARDNRRRSGRMKVDGFIMPSQTTSMENVCQSKNWNEISEEIRNEEVSK